MTPIFADMYYWLALINPRDGAHPEALAISESLTQPVVTTAWVLTEVGDAMRMPANRTTFLQLLHDIAADPETTVVAPTQEWFDRGSAFLRRASIKNGRSRTAFPCSSCRRWDSRKCSRLTATLRKRVSVYS